MAKAKRSDEIKQKLKTAAAMLNHPSLKPSFAAHEAGDAAPQGGGDKSLDVALFQAFCKTTNQPVGSPTTNAADARSAAIQHHISTGHVVSVIQS